MRSSRSPNGILRTFLDLSEKDAASIEGSSLLWHWNSSYGSNWDDLLTGRRILIVSEAGVGKTYECRACQKRLWDLGEPAFFLELATLADTDVINMLGPDERIRFDAWLLAQSETATFFLDSIDELKISQKSFEQALKRLATAIAGHLGRVRVVITTRPIPLDRQLIERHLPVPETSTAEATPESFADVVMRRERRDDSSKAPKALRNVGLMPLTRAQVREFAILQGVTDADALLTDIEHRHAEEYAQRPQDLIELCSDWKEHKRIRKHSEQVETSAANKLKARTDRPEESPLSDARAVDGASRLALAALLTRKLVIRYNAESDSAQSAGPALDAGKVLTDWSQPERDTLLERGLYSFANYGRVRFHHRSVLEYLAAKRLFALLQRGVPVKAIKRILFAETAQGNPIVRPIMRPVAAWLSVWRDDICDEVLRREPETLLMHGDPQSLAPTRRSDVLKKYVERYGTGGWRGLNVPTVQVHRFASSELHATVREIWKSGIENPEVRELILELIGAGRLTACADIAHAVLLDKNAPQRERIEALDALIVLGDRRLAKISSGIASKPGLWSPEISRAAALRLFPAYLNVGQLCLILERTQQRERDVGGLSGRLPQIIGEARLDAKALDDLRSNLTKLVVDSLEWRETGWPNIHTKRPDLLSSLISACARQFREGVRTHELIQSGVLAIRLAKEDRVDDEAVKALRSNLDDASSEERQIAFWADDAFLQSLHSAPDAWHRVYTLSEYGGIHLKTEKDRAWVISTLADESKDLQEREMMLWAAMVLVMPPGDHKENLEKLKQHVSDAPVLLEIIEKRLAPLPADAEMRKLETQRKRRARKEEARDAAANVSWVEFWKEIADNPDEVFNESRAENTAWNLWQAMERSGSDSRASGWNRRFIEQQFGNDVANRLRLTLQRMWRKDKPTLRSERPADKKNTFLVRWQLGLAGIYAEAEDRDWAKNLTKEEALLAARFAPMELNGFPSWLDALVSAHPSAVDATLGGELSASLGEANGDSDATMFLQNIRHASSDLARLFIPRIRAWLDQVSGRRLDPKDPLTARIVQAVDVLIQSEDPDIRKYLESLAAKSLRNSKAGRDEFLVWLPPLMQLNADAGVAALERALASVPPEKYGLGVALFAALFGPDRRGVTVDLHRPEFTVSLLVRLVRLAYKHVRHVDDAHHAGTYSPDQRDDAERARYAILDVLLASTGTEGWAAKIEIANDPLFAHFKDRIIVLARERAAEDAERSAVDEAAVVLLDTYGENPPTTRDAMFGILRDRLDDIDELLLLDYSPRELWAKIADERIMRRELARELQSKANYMYTVDQEAVTADEKETDIRLRATRSDQQAAIEVKIGEKPRSAKALRKTIKDQLLEKYMAADTCRAGCLLITLGASKTWRHPEKRKEMDFDELISFLNEEADRLSSALGDSVRIAVRGLDLRPRLTTERKTRVAKKGSARRAAVPQKMKHLKGKKRNVAVKTLRRTQASRTR